MSVLWRVVLVHEQDEPALWVLLEAAETGPPVRRDMNEKLLAKLNTQLNQVFAALFKMETALELIEELLRDLSREPKTTTKKK